MQKSLLTGVIVPALILVFLVSFQSCKKSDVQESTSAADHDNITALQQAVASSFDLSADKVIYNKSEKQFVVDGDGLVSLEDAQARFSSAGIPGTANATTQRKYNYLVSYSKVNTIKILADATVPATWVAVLDSAIKNWNSTGSKVYMQRITTTTGANMFITTNYSSTSTAIASASYPDNYGNAGRKVYINTYYNSLALAKKVFAITHELGHTIGLMHTDETYGTLVAGTPTTDATSIMNSVCLSWVAFTSSDLTAVRTIYPRPMLPGKKRGI